jgi:hypothetical protein
MQEKDLHRITTTDGFSETVDSPGLALPTLIFFRSSLQHCREIVDCIINEERASAETTTARELLRRT